MKAVVISLIAFLFPNPSLAGEWTGYQIISRPDEIQIHYLQLNIDTRKLCNMLNTQYFDSFQINCPECKLSFKNCYGEIPNSVKKIINNKPWKVPYMSKKHDRTWFIGMTLSESSKYCRKLASQLSSSGYPSQCAE